MFKKVTVVELGGESIRDVESSYLLRLDRVMGVRGISEGVTLVRLDCPWCYTEEGQPVNELIVRESEAELLGVLQQ